MNSITVKILTAVLSVFILIMVGSQIGTRINDSHKTQEATLYTVNENINFNGMFVRNEKVITDESQGVLNYLYHDGSKVTENAVIAKEYENEDQIYYKNRLATLKEARSALKRAQSPGTTNYVQAETLRNQIDEKYASVSQLVAQKNYSLASSTNLDMLYMMNIYNIVTSKESNFKSAIDELKSEIADVKSKIVEPTREIKASMDGYFVSNADGYEKLINYDDVNDMSTKDILSVMNNKKVPQPENAIGKILTNYNWKFVGQIKNTNKFLENSNVSIRFASSNKIYDVNISCIKNIDNSKNSIVVLDCDELDSAVLNERFTDAELIFDEHTGVKIPRDAIRFKDNVRGVYVMLGQKITFKKIDVVYEGDDFVLSKNTSNEDYLLLYDQILLEGVDSDNVTTTSSSS